MWSVEFEIMLSESYNISSYTNLFHVTTGEKGGLEFGNMGSRYPAIFVTADVPKLQFNTDLSGIQNHNFKHTSLLLSDTEWTKVSMKQHEINGAIFLTITVNDQIVHQIENTQPRSFGNMFVYSAHPWHDVGNVYIINLRYTTSPCNFFVDNYYLITPKYYL